MTSSYSHILVTHWPCYMIIINKGCNAIFTYMRETPIEFSGTWKSKEMLDTFCTNCANHDGGNACCLGLDLETRFIKEV